MTTKREIVSRYHEEPVKRKAFAKDALPLLVALREGVCKENVREVFDGPGIEVSISFSKNPISAWVMSAFTHPQSLDVHADVTRGLDALIRMCMEDTCEYPEDK